MKHLLQITSIVLGLAVMLSGCTIFGMPVPTTGSALPTETAPQAFVLSSSAFQADALIPERYSCRGENLSPPLAWSAPPSATQSLVLVMDDPDAVKVVGSVWDHWILFNVPAQATSLPEGVQPKPELPDGSRHGRNSSRGLRYDGPCPPGGQNHGYVFTIYAIDLALDLKAGATKAEVLSAINGHILAEAQLVGHYASP